MIPPPPKSSCELDWTPPRVYVIAPLTSPSVLCPGGLGEAVLAAVGEDPTVVVTRLAVTGVPRSGKPQELLDLHGISAQHIIKAVRQTYAN